MQRATKTGSIRSAIFAWLGAAGLLLATGAHAAEMKDMHTSSVFSGPKANTGTVSHSRQDGKSILTLSDDFKAPETPDPHWQVVDSKGNTYLLEKLMIKPEKFVKSITVPEYVHDVAKVQIWCAFAETVLGEARFSSPLR